MLTVTYAECHIYGPYAEHYIYAPYAECLYAECRYAESRGSNRTTELIKQAGL